MLFNKMSCSFIQNRYGRRSIPHAHDPMNEVRYAHANIVTTNGFSANSHMRAVYTVFVFLQYCCCCSVSPSPSPPANQTHTTTYARDTSILYECEIYKYMYSTFSCEIKNHDRKLGEWVSTIHQYTQSIPEPTSVRQCMVSHMNRQKQEIIR